VKILKLGAVSLTALLVLQFSVRAQSLLSGDIVGAVTDPSHGVVEGASIDLKNLDTGATRGTTTDHSGAYRFSLLGPGSYAVTAKRQGFKPAGKNDIVVLVGNVATADIQLTVGDAAGATTNIQGRTIPAAVGAPTFGDETVTMHAHVRAALQVRTARHSLCVRRNCCGRQQHSCAGNRGVTETAYLVTHDRPPVMLTHEANGSARELCSHSRGLSFG